MISRFQKYNVPATVLLSFVFIPVGCAIPPGEIPRPTLPSLDYTRQLRMEQATTAYEQASRQDSNRAQYQFVSERAQPTDMVSNLTGRSPSFEVHRSSQPMTRPYRGPLNLGEPGVTASLWQETSVAGGLFRDHRAFQPMDLITIVVQESAEGTKEADTDTKKDSSFLGGISNLFNFELNVEEANTGLDTATLVDADFESEYAAEGETTRKGTLTARIAAIVVELLPNGVMRIEGEKVISVNNEEQIMVISGLVRPRDVSSDNEVQSSKIANLRVDYFGRGQIGEAQYAGWFGRLLGVLWPF